MYVHIITDDPLGIGVRNGGAINVTDIDGGPVSEFHEVLAGEGRFIEDAVKALRPTEEYNIDYELLDGAAFSIAFGIPVNTNYLVTSFAANCSADTRPTCSAGCVKPTLAAMIKSYALGAVSIDMSGGFGIVAKWGCAAADEFLSSSCSVSMQTIESMDETSGDYKSDGLYHYGFKQEVSVEAYGEITAPGTAHVTENKTREGRNGAKIYRVSFWQYMDAI